MLQFGWEDLCELTSINTCSISHMCVVRSSCCQLHYDIYDRPMMYSEELLAEVPRQEFRNCASSVCVHCDCMWWWTAWHRSESIISIWYLYDIYMMFHDPVSNFYLIPNCSFRPKSACWSFTARFGELTSTVTQSRRFSERTWRNQGLYKL